MTLNAMLDDYQLALAPLDEKVDHVRGSPAGPLILEYGNYECPYSRQAFHAIEHADSSSPGRCGSRRGSGAGGFPLVAWTHRLKGGRAMAETRRKFGQDFKEGAVRLVPRDG